MKSNLGEIFKSLPCEIITQIEQEMLPPLPQKIRAYKYPFEFCFQQAKLFGVKMIWDKISEKYGPNNSGHNARTFTYRLKMGHIFKYGSGKTEKEAKKRAAQEVMVYLSQFYGTLFFRSFGNLNCQAPSYVNLLMQYQSARNYQILCKYYEDFLEVPPSARISCLLN